MTLSEYLRARCLRAIEEDGHSRGSISRLAGFETSVLSRFLRGAEMKTPNLDALAEAVGLWDPDCLVLKVRTPYLDAPYEALARILNATQDRNSNLRPEFALEDVSAVEDFLAAIRATWADDLAEEVGL